LKDLTEREKIIYNFICEYHKEKGYSPSIREIQEGIFLKSPNMIHRYLQQLVIKNYIEITPHVARSIVIKGTQI